MSAGSTADRGHVSILDPIRGIASLAVVLFHYSGSMLPSITPNALTGILWIGQFGVHAFFVISGFIIPYAMERSGYGIRDIGNFMTRRYLRIAPPAYIAALGVILFHMLGMLITGRPIGTDQWPGLNARSLIGNLIFHPEQISSKWFNFPYWTLMIEFQFYAVIALLFPMLTGALGRSAIPFIIGAILCMSFFDERYFFHYAPFFMLGTSIFLNRHGLLNDTAYALLATLCLALALLVGWIPAVVLAITAGFLHFNLKVRNKLIIWLGCISYSLYIVHVPVGYFAEALFKRVWDIHLDPIGKVIMLVLYTSIALTAAQIFHRWVELPFLQLSRTVPGRRNKVLDRSSL